MRTMTSTFSHSVWVYHVFIVVTFANEFYHYCWTWMKKEKVFWIDHFFIFVADGDMFKCTDGRDPRRHQRHRRLPLLLRTRRTWYVANKEKYFVLLMNILEFPTTGLGSPLRRGWRPYVPMLAEYGARLRCGYLIFPLDVSQPSKGLQLRLTNVIPFYNQHCLTWPLFRITPTSVTHPDIECVDVTYHWWLFLVTECNYYS